MSATLAELVREIVFLRAVIVFLLLVTGFSLSVTAACLYFLHLDNLRVISRRYGARHFGLHPVMRPRSQADDIVDLLQAAERRGVA